MKAVATIGLDIAKKVFQVPGADKSGRPLLRRKLGGGEVSGLPALQEDAESQLTGFGQDLFRSFYEELAQLDEKIADADERIQIAFQNDPDCRRISAVEGVGPLIATAIIAAISNGHAFENRRQFSKWLGPVPGRTQAVAKAD